MVQRLIEEAFKAAFKLHAKMYKEEDWWHTNIFDVILHTTPVFNERCGQSFLIRPSYQPLNSFNEEEVRMNENRQKLDNKTPRKNMTA